MKHIFGDIVVINGFNVVLYNVIVISFTCLFSKYIPVMYNIQHGVYIMVLWQNSLKYVEVQDKSSSFDISDLTSDKMNSLNNKA